MIQSCSLMPLTRMDLTPNYFEFRLEWRKMNLNLEQSLGFWSELCRKSRVKLCLPNFSWTSAEIITCEQSVTSVENEFAAAKTAPIALTTGHKVSTSPCISELTILCAASKHVLSVLPLMAPAHRSKKPVYNFNQRYMLGEEILKTNCVEIWKLFQILLILWFRSKFCC